MRKVKSDTQLFLIFQPSMAESLEIYTYFVKVALSALHGRVSVGGK